VKQGVKQRMKQLLPILRPLWRMVPADWRRNQLHRIARFTAPLPDRNPPPPRSGIAVLGEIGVPSGLGESARMMVLALRNLGVAVYPIDSALGGVLTGGTTAEMPPPQVPIVIHANPHRLGTALLALPRHAVRGRRIIGYFAWELLVAPPAWSPHLRLVHEIWVPSQFVAEAMKTIMPGDRVVPIRVIPIALAEAPPVPSGLSRSDFGLPEDAVIVLVSFNLASGFARKNPLGAVEAFRRAFGARLDRRLILKVGNPQAAPADFARLQLAIADLPNAVIDHRKLSRDDNYAFTAAADIVLSLHRSEGFGIVMAEAMSLGRPVVATAWSGNMDFMDEHSAALVPASLVPPDDPSGEFDVPGALWADPDLEIAAAQLRRLADDPAARIELGLAGQSMVRARLTAEPLRQAALDLGLPVGAS
jgi:glycosyltransferase involved in cell wall biosynthesis